MSAHFSFTKSLYDDCNLTKKDQESTGAFKWITDSVYENPNNCNINASPFMHNQFKNIPAAAVDIENDLRNQTRVLSRCPSSRFDPSKVVNNNKFTSKLEDCKSQALVPEYTRINKPCNIFSGVSINRFHPLCEDLQDVNKIQSNSYIGTNTRLQIKDAFNKAKELEPKRSGAVPLFNPEPYKL
jgi:hypothetical protein